jgi:hypothetical protein
LKVVLMPTLARPVPFLEAARLKRSVSALEATRDHCHHCHRTPLVGERVFIYGAAMVCELCRPLRRSAPDASRLVFSPEHDRAVRVRRAA